MCQSFKHLKEICELDNNQYVISKTLRSYVTDEKGWKKFISNIIYVFIGDNPGEIEKQAEEYFCCDLAKNIKSKTGENTHKFIENFLKVSSKDINNKILFLNKSLKSTKETISLYNEDCSNDKSLILITNLIKAIVDENKNVFVCLFGIDSFHAEYFFGFVEGIKGIDGLGLYPHPSRRQPISLKEQCEIDGFDENEFFKTYGKIRLKDESKCNLIERCKEELKKQ